MKKVLLFFFVLLSGALLFSASVVDNATEHPFDSIPMLETYYDVDQVIVSEGSYWAKCKIELLTVSRGNPLYSWFGHCAILVTPPNGDRPVMYDYGTFTFNSKFYTNFIMGRLWYNVICTYGDLRLASIKESGRTIRAVELELTPAQKYAVIDFLNMNTDEEYNTYLYHHYKDNCATRVRDILNYVTEGDFEAWAKAQEGNTFREETSRILINNRPVMWLLDFIQSGVIDKDATRWDEMFLPENLEKAVLDYGKFGTKTSYYSDFRDSDKRPPNALTPKSDMLFSAIVGLDLLFVAYIGLRRYRKFYKVQGFIVNLVLGLIGSVLFFMMNFTTHDVSYFNENILFVNPALIALAVLHLTDKKGKATVVFYRVLFGICLALMLCKCILPSVFLQKNWSQIVLVFPYYAINAFVKRRDLKTENI